MSHILRTLTAALALAFAGAAYAAPQAGGLYFGEIGPGNQVLVSLKPADPTSGASGAVPMSLTGEYHYARIWSQDRLELSGEIAADDRIAMHETLVGPRGQRRQTGAFKGRVAQGGDWISGTWASGDGRHTHAFVLVRAAEWTRQSVVADDGIRTCVRPRFFDQRYEKLNGELAQACDLFLADGHEGPGLLTLEIDSLSGSVVAAVGYATNRGHESPPEVITVDVSSPVSIPAIPAPVPDLLAHQ
jgi:hypothetical protein